MRLLRTKIGFQNHVLVPIIVESTNFTYLVVNVNFTRPQQIGLSLSVVINKQNIFGSL